MVVSDRLLFVHVPKTGGISCREWLVDNVPGAIHPLTDKRSQIAEPHLPLRHVEETTGRTLDSFDRIIAVIRDPYAQQLAMWSHQRTQYALGGRHPLQMAAATKPDIEAWLRDRACDWRFWYEIQRSGMTSEGWRAAETVVSEIGYYEYTLAVNGELPPNLVLVDFANLARGVAQAAAPFLVPDPSPFPHHQRTELRSARPFYTPLALQLIAQKFNWCFGRGWFQGQDA